MGSRPRCLAPDLMDSTGATLLLDGGLHDGQMVLEGVSPPATRHRPGALVFLLLIGHIPSGPTFPFAISWVTVGAMLLSRKGSKPSALKHPA